MSRTDSDKISRFSLTAEFWVSSSLDIRVHGDIKGLGEENKLMGLQVPEGRVNKDRDRTPS